MTQIVQPQVHVSSFRSRRGLVLATLGALVAAATALILVFAIGTSENAPSIPRAQSYAPAADAGPAAGTPSAVAQALGSEHVRGGFSLTTNVPAPPRVDAGPSSGTPSAVSEALRRPEPRFPPPGTRLTTNVPARPRADAGPSAGTPTAVRDALSAR